MFQLTAEYESRVKEIFKAMFINAEPLEYFETFLTHDIISLIIDETILNAIQTLTAVQETSSMENQLIKLKQIDFLLL